MDIQEQLEGTKVVLKKYHATFELAQKLYDLTIENKEHLLRWMNWAVPLVSGRVEDEFAFLKICEEDWENKSHFEFGIYEKETGEIVGGIGLIKLSPSCDKKAEIGYWLVKKACKKGYMQEAVRLVEKFAFDLGYNRLVIRNEVSNAASRHVAERLGYAFEGVERQGHFCLAHKQFADINVFSKLRSEYEKGA